jgi:hypothetical protein
LLGRGLGGLGIGLLFVAASDGADMIELAVVDGWKGGLQIAN